MVYPSGPWKLICSTVVDFLPSFVYPGVFNSKLVDVSRKAEAVYPTGTPAPCSQFLVGPSCSLTFFTLHLSFWLFYVLCVCFPFLVLSLDYTLLISARILFLLITLSLTLVFAFSYPFCRLIRSWLLFKSEGKTTII